MSRSRPAAASAMVVVLALVLSAPAGAVPKVSEFTGGVTPGFTVKASPEGITTGPDGNVWFTESKAPGRLARLNLSSNTVTEFTGGVTTGFTAGKSPSGIAAGHDGNVWFTELSGGGVARFNLSSNTVTEFTGGVTSGFSANGLPYAITSGPDGLMWFTEQTNPGRVGRVNGDETVTEFSGGVTPGFTADAIPSSIAVGADGAIWFTEFGDPGRIGRLDPSLNAVTEFTGGVTSGFSSDAGPLGITAGPDGPMWFTQEHVPGRVARLTSGVSEFTGGLTPGFSSGGGPGGIAAGPDGNVWFVEFNSPGRVARVTPFGQVTEFTGGVTQGFSATGGPVKIAAGPDGAMWFTENNDPGRVGRITVGPGVVTEAASSIGPTSATLSGSVRPNGQTTAYRFEYGTAFAYGSQTGDAAAGNGLAPQTVSANLAGLLPDTLYHYRLTATNDSDPTVGFDRTFRTAPAAALRGAADGNSNGNGGNGTAANGVSRVSALRFSRSAFPAATTGPSARSATGARSRSTGAIVSFRLDQPASVRFTVERARMGRRVGGRCAAPRKSNSSRRRCTRYVRLRGAFTRGGHTALNRFRFTGRLRGRPLRVGRYRLVATARQGTRSGKSSRAGFRITR